MRRAIVHLSSNCLNNLIASSLNLKTRFTFNMPTTNFTRFTMLLLVSTYIVPRTLATSTNQFSIKGGATEQSKPKQSTYRSSRRLLTCAGGSTNDCPSTEICQSATCTSCEWPLFPSPTLLHKGYVMRRLCYYLNIFFFSLIVHSSLYN